ncbi:MAG TPA: hypothetical protein VNT03_18490 [Baekduia sp.]|nr:hypothetical protein [Baekduia sp.]
MLLRATFLTLLALGASAAVASADYVEIERPYSYVEAIGVNSSGVVLGEASTDIANPNDTHVPFTWNGGYTLLPPAPSSAGRALVRTAAFDINDQGRIVGATGYTNPIYECSFWQPRINRGVVWAGAGVLTELGGLPHDGSSGSCTWVPGTGPVALNGAGVVLGRSEATTVTAAAGSSSVTPLPAHCPTSSETALAINDAGTVVLQCASSARTVSALGVVTDLPLNFFPVARGITPSGVVLGRMDSLPAKVVGASSVTTLQPLPGFTGATAEAIADDGTVVGESRAGDTMHATLWRPDGTAVDLNTMAPGATGPLVTATDISPDGAYIIGRVSAPAGQTDAPIYRIGAGRDTLEVELTAATPDGRPLNTGDLTEQQAFDVRVTLKNTSTTATIKDLRYANGAPLTIDGRSIARVGILAAPAGAPPATLGPGERATFDYRLTAATDGVAAAVVKVTGADDSGTPQEATGSLKLSVTQAGRLNAALAQWARVQGMDTLMLAAARKLYQGWDKRGQALQAALRKALSPAERKRWFGTAAKKLAVDNLDVARALLMGRSPTATAAQFPNRSIAGIAAEDMYDEYNKAFMAEVGRGVAKYVKKWQDLGHGARKQAQLAYAESGLALSYIMNSASQDQREEAEAMVLAFSDGVVEDTSSYAAWTKNEASNLLNDGQALIYTLANMDQGAQDVADAISAPFERDAAARREIMKYADTEPIRFQREMARLDGKIFNTGMEVVADTVVGGTATKLITSTGKVVQLGKKGAALLNIAKATEVVDESGKLAKGLDAVKDTKKALGVGMAGEEAAALQDGEAALKSVDGATVVRSSDYGNVYELPNIGGVPEVTLDAKAGILKSVEGDFADTFGRPIELAEVLKPSTELRKPGAVAKLELTGQKTGKPAMIDAGMPPDALGEAVLWKPKVKPQDIPGFKNLSESRQAAAIKEYENALKANAEWRNPAAGSKTAKLKQLIGKEGTVPLDDHPWPGGLQRFVSGEFELVKVPGEYADAYLIRVKKYALVVKDTARGGKVVNTKTVVNSTKALAQGVDADAVGVAKVVGRDAAGKPILAPLEASERSFVMSRYIDRNIKARAAGLQTDLAEHGATLVMDDADALHAGFLGPKFGVPFMPEDVGIPFLKRIAQFVIPKGSGLTTEQMVQNMLGAVRSEGGFGQHAVILTKDTRYLGDVPLQAW